MALFSPWLRTILRPLWPQYRALVQYSLFVNLLALATPVFVLQIYDRVVFHSGLSTLQGLSLGMAVVIVFDFLLRQARSRLMQQVSLRIDAALGRQLFFKLTALPLRALESRPGSFWQSIFRDMDQVRNMLGGPTAVLLVDLPFVLLFIGLIFIIAAPIVWVLFVALGAFVGLAWWSSSAVQTASLAERQTALARDALVAEIVAGRTTVKALAIGESLRPVWEDRHVDAIETSIQRGQVSDRFGNLGMEMTIFTTIAMTVVGALAILDQQMTIGGLIAANMLSTRIIAPLNQLVGAWRGFATYREATERLDEMLSMPEERQDTELEFDRPTGVVSIQQLEFNYDEDAPQVINNHAYTIKPGGLHGIVGRNGSGKSTLLKLMQGLYTPTSGRVLLDDADVQQFTRGELALWYGYVPQECFLFAGTVRDNICKVVPDATDERVLALTRRLGLHDDITDLPDGYNTDIGEAGMRLSAGQRQK
ncbi:MAG: ABC transporter transmembrane domain-containing protein, partial [Alphaproteobacteria bacterium]